MATTAGALPTANTPPYSDPPHSVVTESAEPHWLIRAMSGQHTTHFSFRPKWLDFMVMVAVLGHELYTEIM